jgi:hypothetical protein
MLLNVLKEHRKAEQQEAAIIHLGQNFSLSLLNSSRKLKR